MAKNKTVKTEATSKETVAQTTSETVKAEATSAEAVKAEASVAEQATEPLKAEPTMAQKVIETVKAEAAKAELPVAEKVVAATAAATEAVKAEAAVTEAAGQVTSFVKGRLEQVQRQFGELEADAQKVLQTLVSRGRESGREVLQRSVSELRGNPTVQKLEKQATWVGGEVRQRLGGLRSRMVTVVGGVASQSQVDAINRELDRLTNKLDSLVSPKKAETQQQPPQQAQPQQTQQQAQ